jgi:hypothetical protein
MRVDLESGTACTIHRMTASARCLSKAAVPLSAKHGHMDFGSERLGWVETETAASECPTATSRRSLLDTVDGRFSTNVTTSRA